jgi:predicted Rossmann-fold nucleotide-binding protein
MNDTIRPRRLLVSGAGQLSPRAAVLWRALGELLAQETTSLVVITGGLAGREGELHPLTADHSIVQGMLPVLLQRGIPAGERIETVLPDARQEHGEFVRFREGRVRVLERRNAQSRRFSMVHSADAVIAVEGGNGTRSVLDMALAVDRPILPLPFGGGASEEVWDDQRDDILRWFRIDSEEADAFDRTRLEDLDDAGVRDLARRVHDCLMRGFTQGCFVIMPMNPDHDPVYDQAILPALIANQFQPWRTDRTVTTGDVIEAIHDGINHCHFVIADTTGDRPNVMYELGLAHAARKPVLLLRKTNPDGSLPPLPFDFQSHSILKYSADVAELGRRLEAAIAVLAGRQSENEREN